MSTIEISEEELKELADADAKALIARAVHAVSDFSAHIENVLPGTSKERKDIPLARGCIDYFPAALAEVAKLSRLGNDKHNPGQPIHWSRGKSNDHRDCIARHLVDCGTIDPEDGVYHDVKLAWRALANLQELLERNGAPMARGAWEDK